MTTMTIVDVIAGTRLPSGYAVPSARPRGDQFWRQIPHVSLVGFVVKNNSTGVSEVEYRHR